MHFAENPRIFVDSDRNVDSTDSTLLSDITKIKANFENYHQLSQLNFEIKILHL